MPTRPPIPLDPVERFGAQGVPEPSPGERRARRQQRIEELRDSIAACTDDIKRARNELADLMIEQAKNEALLARLEGEKHVRE